MIRPNQHIIFVAEGMTIAYHKKDQQKEIRNSGFSVKKILITSSRLLIFDSLSNRLAQTQYQLSNPLSKNTQKTNTSNHNRYKISVNDYPEAAFDVDPFQSKVLIEEEPLVFKYLQKQSVGNMVKNLSGTVLLKNVRKKNFFLICFGSIKNAIRFCKALICAQSWKEYMKFCGQMKCEINYQWIRILLDVINNENSVVTIDPDFFLSGSPSQIQTFNFLISVIPFAHCFNLRFSITNEQSSTYASNFISAFQQKIHSLNLQQTHIDNLHLNQIINKVNLTNIMQIDLQKNKLDEQVFQIIHKIMKNGSKKLSFINLSHNLIIMQNSIALVQVLKEATVILNLNLSYNLITDGALQAIEKYITFSVNPPLQEVNLSFNKFSRKAAWRLYVGNLQNFKFHPYMRFILYPVPIKKQIFSQFEIDFPRHQETINLNMHSALLEQFQQQSILKHTFEDALNLNKQNLTIKFIRVSNLNVKLPNNKQELNRTLQISNKVENFIYASQTVEKIYEMALELKEFPFQVPPISRAHFVRYVLQKFNEALFIRDHYSVKYLFKAIIDLSIPFDGYQERIYKLEERNKIFKNRVESILNFNIDEESINQELDVMVKEGLRLYLEGGGVQMLYYLKFKRDQYIEKYLAEKVNPEHELFEIMAKKNISSDQRVSEKEFLVPYEIRLEKKINQNFYLHPWQTNYQILAYMKPSTFDSCLQFLEENEKKQKFALYFDRIQERIEFIKNQFSYFAYNKFKVSYSDLKINACRLIYLYNNIKQTNIYLELPIYIKKKNITPEQKIQIQNPQWFKRQYHIAKYKNINLKARKAHFYNYPDIISKYEAQIFKNQADKILRNLFNIFRIMEKEIRVKTSKQVIIKQIIDDFKNIIDIVRHSLIPEELKEEIYLHLIAWKKGKYGGNTQILQLLPAFTMYLKPPLTIQKYLVASILFNQQIQLLNFPLCLVSNQNEQTSQQIGTLSKDFVERDWVPSDDTFCELFLFKGMVTLEIQLLEKKRIVLMVQQSITVSDLMEKLINYPQMSSDDRQNFWLFKMSKQTQQLSPFESRDHIGEILSDLKLQDGVLVLKRRIYCQELRYNYRKYQQCLINSLYHDIKFEYLARGFFINDQRVYDIASIIFVVNCIENLQNQRKNKKKKNFNLEEDNDDDVNQEIFKRTKQLDSNFLSFVPRKTYSRLMKQKEVFIKELKGRISQRILKREHSAIFQMKLNFLRIFQKHPQFMSTNHKLSNKDGRELKISLNCMYIYVDSEYEAQVIQLEKIISFIPKAKYLLLYYHKHENIVAQLAMFAQQKYIFAIAMDILAYCSMRIKMASNNLYEIHSIEGLEKKIGNYELTLKKSYDKNIDKEMQKCKEDYETIRKKVFKLSLTLMQLKDYQYFMKSRYIKSQVNRRLYANKTQKKLQIREQNDQEQIQEEEAANQRILELLFPQIKSHTKIQSFFKDTIPPPNRYQPNEESIDYQRQYDKINENTQKKEPERNRNQIGEYQAATLKKDHPNQLQKYNYQQENMTPLRQEQNEKNQSSTKPRTNKIQLQEQQPEKVITGKRKKDPPKRRNR